MGLILDTSLFIADERGRLDLRRFVDGYPDDPMALSPITAAELLHGVERTADSLRHSKRASYVENVLRVFYIVPFELSHGRIYARLWLIWLGGAQ